MCLVMEAVLKFMRVMLMWEKVMVINFCTGR